jgi:catechol 2,3-dioxygenase-like lactoylglutathione lyase family enzyme
MIGRMHHVVLDCPEPTVMAEFYSALLGLPVTYDDGDWVVVAASAQSSGLAFQRATGYRAPTWPDPAVPQQLHLDIMVEDPVTAGRQVVELGAVKLEGENVYADPVGHPFCLIQRPGWSSPIPHGDLTGQLPGGERAAAHTARHLWAREDWTTWMCMKPWALAGPCGRSAISQYPGRYSNEYWPQRHGLRQAGTSSRGGCTS